MTKYNMKLSNGIFLSILAIVVISYVALLIAITSKPLAIAWFLYMSYKCLWWSKMPGINRIFQDVSNNIALDILSLKLNEELTLQFKDESITIKRVKWWNCTFIFTSMK